jgi:transcriptional regulator with XRE-family HTH domain
MTRRTVPLGLTVVNTVMPMETRGSRLRAYLLTKTGGAHGWVNELASRSGVKRQTLSAWMGDRSQPDLASLEAIGGVLGVRTFEIVAAMDGDVAVAVTDPRVREAIREEMESLLDERLGHRPEGDGRSGAA